MKSLFLVIKSLVGALSWQLVGDSFRAVLGRIEWAVVFERLLTRILISCLRWLERLSTNDVIDSTVLEIADMLEQKRLVKAKEYQKQIDKRTSRQTQSTQTNKDL